MENQEQLIKELQKQGFSRKSAEIFRIIYYEKTISYKDLRRIVDIKKSSNFSYYIKSLRNEGYLESQRDKYNQRLRTLIITSKGKNLIDKNCRGIVK